MIKTFIFGLLLLLLTFTPAVFSSTHLTSRVIIIDPGHGGSDSGSTACEGLSEKAANLDIAEHLKVLLEANGAEVFMTRTNDSTKSNNDRYTFANDNNGEVLVSIHLNGSTDTSVNGTQGLYGKRNKDKKFTEIIHTRLVAELNVTDRGVTNFASGVLLKSDMPATIQESVFISNTEECITLRDGDGSRQQEIAQSLYNGLSDWFRLPPDDEGGNGGGKPDNPGGGRPR